jgi:pimeloyl-ACP methyl ester carboxylesterase
VSTPDSTLWMRVRVGYPAGVDDTAVDLAALAGHVVAPDGTAIGWFREPGDSDGQPLLLVHGATADHTTFRVFAPRMAASRLVFPIDRRGRGASGDTLPYAIEREFEDLAAMAEAVATATGRDVDAFGHSYGGRVAMGAATLTPRIRRVVTYEGAVTPGIGERQPGMIERLDTLLAADQRADLLEVFLRDVVDLTPEEWQAFRIAETYPRRIAAAHTVLRELRAGSTADASLDRYAAVTQPVLQVLGSESPAVFHEGAEALAGRLADGRLAVIEGARHAAHHTHVQALVEAVRAFLDEPRG